MSLLILNKRPLRTTPYSDWLVDAENDVVLFSAMENQSIEDQNIAKEKYSEVRFFTDYDTGMLEAAVLELHQRRPITQIVALSEVDLFRAGCLRERLGLSGMTAKDAVAFRDKYVMKSRLEAAGIRVPKMKELRSATDLIRFAEEAGFPFVLKPRSSAGAMGVTVVKGASELLESLRSPEFGAYGVATGLMAEEHVAGELYHIDGIAMNGEVAFSWPSHYMHGILDFISCRQPCSSVMLAPENPLTARLKEFTRVCVEALPFPSYATAFHAEAFVKPTGEIVLCEIAARPGGGGITELLKKAFGIDLNELATRGAAGQMVCVPNNPRPLLHAMILFPKKVGRLEKIAQACELPFVSNYSASAKMGVRFDGSKNSIDRSASGFVSAINEVELRKSVSEFVSWFDERVVWVENA